MSPIEVQLDKFAASDLRAARKHGEIAIAQTKKGTLFLRHAGGVYTLSTAGLDTEDLAQGKPSVVRPVLVSLYDCQEG